MPVSDWNWGMVLGNEKSVEINIELPREQLWKSELNTRVIMIMTVLSSVGALTF